jgi:cysteine desulfuration protein SufE
MFVPAIYSINEAQEQIIEDFKPLAKEREATLHYLMELGQQIPPIDPAYKKDTNLLPGCMSQVWIYGQVQTERLYLAADSNTAITKGLIALLLRVFSGQEITAITKADLYCLAEIGLTDFLGMQRTQGIANMLLKIKKLAVSEQKK